MDFWGQSSLDRASVKPVHNPALDKYWMIDSLKTRALAVLTFLKSSAIRRAMAGVIIAGLAATLGVVIDSHTIEDVIYLATCVGLALLHSPKSVEE